MSVKIGLMSVYIVLVIVYIVLMGVNFELMGVFTCFYCGIGCIHGLFILWQ